MGYSFREWDDVYGLCCKWILEYGDSLLVDVWDVEYEHQVVIDDVYSLEVMLRENLGASEELQYNILLHKVAKPRRDKK